MKANQKNTQDCLKDKILSLVKEYYKSSSSRDKFVPGKSYIHYYGGRYYNEKEMANLVDSSLDFWFTQGSWIQKFESEFTKWLRVILCSVTNSSSYAILIEFTSLAAPELNEKQIKKGDEVITVACAFPNFVTTIGRMSGYEMRVYGIKDRDFAKEILKGRAKKIHSVYCKLSYTYARVRKMTAFTLSRYLGGIK